MRGVYFKSPPLSLFMACLACIGGGFALFYGWFYKEGQENLLRETETAYTYAVQQKASEETWQRLKNQHKESWERITKIQKASTLTPDKVSRFLEKLAKAHGLMDVTAQGSAPSPAASHPSSFSFISCTITGKAMADWSIFQFMTSITTHVPSVPIIHECKIDRLSPLTKQVLGDIMAKKPVALFSFSVTIHWLLGEIPS